MGKKPGEKKGRIPKKLGTLDIFSIATGAMISSGLFVLPAVVFGKVGPASILAYLLASLCVVPSLFAKAELSSAMPKSGGTYFFITRSFGPLVGIFSGLAAWFSLSLKSAFALLGIGIFLQPLLSAYSPHMVKLIAIGCTVLFTVLNLLSVKETGRIQIILVFLLIVLVVFYVSTGISKLDINRLIPFKTTSWRPILTSVGLVFVSFGGLTKVASVAEEVKTPGKTIPRGMFTAFFIVTLLYLLVIFTTIGILPRAEFFTTLTPISLGASKVTGQAGFLLLSFAAMISFITTGNAGILAASRTPMAMARDRLLPRFLGKVSERFQTPVFSILLTSVFMILCILFLELETLIKVASTMKLLLFTFVLLSVIIMRSSKLVSYKPTYRSPLYPVIHIIGICAYIFLIIEMGKIPLLITGGFFLLSIMWYFLFTRKHVRQKSAFVHMVEKLTNRELVKDRTVLEGQLIDILRERDEVKEDRFDSIVRQAAVIDMDRTVNRSEFFAVVAETIGGRWGIDPGHVAEKLNQREEQSSTLLYPGVAVPHAVPHIVVDGKGVFDIVLVRNKFGIIWNEWEEGTGEGISQDVVYTAFCLIGSKDERNFHLKALMSIAQVLQDPEFHKAWHRARNADELRSVILVSKRRRS